MDALLDIETIPLDDEATWDMICQGKVKGCFQIESHLGKTWCKKVKPRTIEELSDVIALIRPGTLKAVVDGKNMAQHYVDRKLGKDEIKSIHPSVDNILKPTYGISLYQEQSLQIAKDMAKFTPLEANTLRKAIGKKDAKLMTSLKERFISGSVDNATPQGVADSVFDIIEKSNRYAFNKCLDPETVVETPSGYKLLSEIIIGDKVLAPKDLYNDEYVEVLDVIDSGTQELYEIELETGESIRCSLSHKFLCSDGKKYPLSEILLNDLEIMVYNN